MSAILGLSPEEGSDKEALVDAVWKDMWKLNQTYRVRLNDEDKEGTPVWCTQHPPKYLTRLWFGLVWFDLAAVELTLPVTVTV
jgi:hypothetical protein